MNRPCWHFVCSLVCSVALIAGAADASGAIRPVPGQDETSWKHHLIPLPKHIRFEGRTEVAANQVGISIAAEPGPLVEQAVKELTAALGSPDEPVATEDAAFTIAFRQGGPEAERLAHLPNADQAYRIIPAVEGSGLVLTARTPMGLYYAAKTLQQLIKARARDGKVVMPLVDVADWPDLKDRGLWGCYSFLHISWLSDRKMNYMEQLANTRVVSRQRTSVELSRPKQVMLTQGPSHAVQPVPIVVHLELQHGGGLFDVYPELRAQGGEKGAICYAQPVMVDILADWIAGFAEMPGVSEVDVWMSENLHGKGGCRCPKCRKRNRDLQEAGVIVSAWQKARKRAPGLGLRILTSEETYDSNEKMLADLPPAVGIWYYESLLTYTTGRSPMVPAYLEQLAGEGRVVGVCCNLTPIVALTHPFTGAAFVHYRMNEFVRKGMTSLLGFPTPRIPLTAFNVEAAAEWSWNATGRSTREFAHAWAVRQRTNDPELFAEWSETLGPVAWDVYGSDWPLHGQRKALKSVTEHLKAGTLPGLGELTGAFRSPFGDIKTVEQLNEDVAQARKAVVLARRLEDQAALQESLVVQGYINSLKALWELRCLITPEGVAAKDRAATERYVEMYLDGLEQARAALPKWLTAVMPEAKAEDYLGSSFRLLGGMQERMKALASDLGLEIDGPPGKGKEVENNVGAAGKRCTTRRNRASYAAGGERRR